MKREVVTPDEAQMERLQCTCRAVAQWMPIVIGGLGVVVVAAWLMFALWMLIEVMV